jgi:hypothetical protein
MSRFAVLRKAAENRTTMTGKFGTVVANFWKCPIYECLYHL